MKKLIAFGIALCMIFGMCACGQSDEGAIVGNTDKDTVVTDTTSPDTVVIQNPNTEVNTDSAIGNADETLDIEVNTNDVVDSKDDISESTEIGEDAQDETVDTEDNSDESVDKPETPTEAPVEGPTETPTEAPTDEPNEGSQTGVKEPLDTEFIEPGDGNEVPNIEETGEDITHAVISNVPYSGESESVNTIKFTIAGDCMLASYMGQVSAGNFADTALKGDWEYFLDGVDEYFESDDFTIVNLENVLTDNSSLKEVAKDHNPAYWYKAPTANTNILTTQSVEVVSLANNHFGDYGTKGRNDTMAACDAAGLLWGSNDKTIYVEKNGYKIAVICHGLWGEWQADTIVPRINEAEEKSDFQIVYYHGGKERIHNPEQWKVRASRKLVDAGADLVIGNHPHVLQPMEIYNGVPIIYSMGNFCYGGSSRPENRTIMYRFEITVDNETKDIIHTYSEIVPCYVYTGDKNNWQPAIITDEVQKQKVLDFMNWKVDSPV